MYKYAPWGSDEYLKEKNRLRIPINSVNAVDTTINFQNGFQMWPGIIDILDQDNTYEKSCNWYTPKESSLKH